MKKLKLCTGRFAKVDEKHFDKLKNYHWHENGKHAFRFRGNSRVYLHRQVMEMEGHDIEDMVVDHRNTNGLDCQAENLRVVTIQQNAFNRPAKRGSTSKYKGVTVRGKKYEARIMKNGQEIYLGRYWSETEAAKVYNDKAMEIFGEHAFLNEV